MSSTETPQPATPDSEPTPAGAWSPFGGALREEWPQVEGYTLDSLLGAGGHSRVYLARTPEGRAVALKVWRNRASLSLQARAKREVEALRALPAHPNLVRFVDATADAAGNPCLVTEVVVGRSLAETLAVEGSLEPAQLHALTGPLLDAIEHLAGHGLVHRDLKPANVVLRDSDGAPVVVDFSVAAWTTNHEADSSTTVTGVGEGVGTSAYMAPEQCPGEVGAIDVRTDLYGLGATLFHAATGIPPWSRESAWERTQRNPWRHPYPSEPARGERVSRARRGLPGLWSRILERALQGDPTKRFQSPADFRQALAAPRAAPATGWQVFAALGLALAAGLFLSFRNPSQVGSPIQGKEPTAPEEDPMRSPSLAAVSTLAAISSLIPNAFAAEPVLKVYDLARLVRAEDEVGPRIAFAGVIPRQGGGVLEFDDGPEELFAQELADLVQEVVAPESWDPPHSIQISGPRALRVRHTAAVHKEVKALLTALAATRAQPLQVELWFLELAEGASWPRTHEAISALKLTDAAVTAIERRLLPGVLAEVNEVSQTERLKHARSIGLRAARVPGGRARLELRAELLSPEPDTARSRFLRLETVSQVKLDGRWQVIAEGSGHGRRVSVCARSSSVGKSPEAPKGLTLIDLAPLKAPSVAVRGGQGVPVAGGGGGITFDDEVPEILIKQTASNASGLTCAWGAGFLVVKGSQEARDLAVQAECQPQVAKALHAWLLPSFPTESLRGAPLIEQARRVFGSRWNAADRGQELASVSFYGPWVGEGCVVELGSQHDGAPAEWLSLGLTAESEASMRLSSRVRTDAHGPPLALELPDNASARMLRLKVREAPWIWVAAR